MILLDVPSVNIVLVSMFIFSRFSYMHCPCHQTTERFVTQKIVYTLYVYRQNFLWVMISITYQDTVALIILWFSDDRRAFGGTGTDDGRQRTSWCDRLPSIYILFDVRTANDRQTTGFLVCGMTCRIVSRAYGLKKTRVWNTYKYRASHYRIYLLRFNLW